MRIDHRDTNVFVVEMLLDGSDVAAVFKQMCRAKLSVLWPSRLTVLALLYSYFICNLKEML